VSEQSQSGRRTEPRPSRPNIPGYGIPASEEGLLPWSHVRERMENAYNYWIGTTRPDGRPHATPVWGVWLDYTLYFGGSPNTRRGRDLAANPAVVVHLESGSDVVILEGEAHELHAPDRALATRVAAAYAAKYATLGYEPSPDAWDDGGLYAVRPRVAFAWTRFPEDATRWHFNAD
jgi:nitroimidazol reductase NimA-like FMN-containing flavoprotein (pyridoxamine 5'-phosphate oxidase superfamily)